MKLLLSKCWALSSLASLLAILLIASTSRARAEQFNVVLLVADDLGWTDLGCYGSPLHQTPHLDRLADQGVRFTNAYAGACSCSPSRAALMTGKYSARVGMTAITEKHRGDLAPDDSRLLPATTRPFLADSEISIGEALKSLGYSTCYVGKWHLGEGSHGPAGQGFDVTIGSPHKGMPKSYFWPAWRGNPNIEGHFEGEYLTDRLAEEACDFIQSHTASQQQVSSNSPDASAKQEPFFLCLSFHSVHVPIEAKADLVAKYQQYLDSGKNRDSRHKNPYYAAMVESLDAAVGSVLDTVEQLGLTDDTLVLFTSDNGGLVHPSAVGQHTPATSNYPLRSGKGFLYEGGIRVPLIVRWPGVSSSGETCETPVHGCDVFPTICAAGGKQVSKASESSLDGQSLIPLLQDPHAETGNRALFWHYPHFSSMGGRPSAAMRKGPWKLHVSLESGIAELYNLEEDLSETHDLSEAEPKRAQEMQAALESWQQEMQALFPVRENPNFKDATP